MNQVTVSAAYIGGLVQYTAYADGGAGPPIPSAETIKTRKGSPFAAVKLDAEGVPSILKMGKRETLDIAYGDLNGHDIVPVAFDPDYWTWTDLGADILIGRVFDEYVYRKGRHVRTGVRHRDLVAIRDGQGWTRLVCNLRKEHDWAVPVKTDDSWRVVATEQTFEDAAPWGRLYGYKPVPIVRFATFGGVQAYLGLDA